MSNYLIIDYFYGWKLVSKNGRRVYLTNSISMMLIMLYLQ